MLILPVVNAATATVTAVLALSSARNMLQTVHLSRANSAQSNLPRSIDPMSPTEAVLRELQSLKRKELFQVYLGSRSPTDLSEIEGEWDGILLDNNGWIMTGVSGFISNRLFGRGRKWNGKAFSSDTSEGINRFRVERSNNPQKLSIEKEHEFKASLIASKLGSQQTSVILDYTQYQPWFSLWRTMTDEIRIVPLDGSVRVLIGLGYMAWSGGRFNAQPFVLYRSSSDSLSETLSENSAVE